MFGRLSCERRRALRALHLGQASQKQPMAASEFEDYLGIALLCATEGWCQLGRLRGIKGSCADGPAILGSRTRLQHAVDYLPSTSSIARSKLALDYRIADLRAPAAIVQRHGAVDVVRL